MIHGAIDLAKLWGVSDLIIGLTLVAIGTSLPELMASLLSAWRGESDIAIGNAIGSNTLGILAVLIFPGLIAPGALPAAAIKRDFPVMVAVTLLLVVLLIFKKHQAHCIGRVIGVLLLLAFIGYMLLVCYSRFSY